MIADWGYVPGPDPLPKGTCAARVVATHGDYYRVVCDEGECLARKKASAYLGCAATARPTTGDFVALKWNPQGEGRIFATLPRQAVFERADPTSEGRRAQLIAVNYDVLFFLTSANQNFSVRRIERFLSLGRAAGAPVVVLVTKIDLVTSAEAERLVAAARAHAPGAVDVRGISALRGTGLAALAAAYVKPRRTVALVGSSGVGKSSLVNALAGQDIMPTLEIRAWDAKGRHTTTERELVRLPSGALILDTPGLREVGMWEAEAGLTEAFRDVEALFAHCRFSDCRHGTEPGCAIKAALAAGTLAADRWCAYQRLKAESARLETPHVASTHRYRK